MSLVGTHIGHVRIDRLVGKGGMGKVYLGVDEKLERQVAVKVLAAERRLKPEAKARFLREARLLSRLDDPGICRIYDLVEDEDTDYLILELIDGVTLADAVRRAAGDDEKLVLFLGVVRALAAAHREGIVHRDLKPDNVMVTSQGQVKVLDFGIARSVAAQVVATPGASRQDERDRDATMAQAVAETEPGLGRTRTMAPGEGESDALEDSEAAVHTLRTRVGSLMGTIRYMSPEQASGEPVTEASDLYSLGVMMQELLSGRPAYGQSSGMDLLLKVYRAETVPVTGLDAEVASLITDLTRIDPASRPDAETTGERLQHILDRPQRERRRRVRIAAIGLVTAAALVAAGVAVHARLQAGRRAALAQSFARQAEEIAWRMRAEHLSPVHDIRPAMAEVRRRMDELEQRTGELGALAGGPGNAAVGRGHLALGELDEARRHLEAANEAGFRSPEADFALGLVYGRIYRRELGRVGRIADPDSKSLEMERIQRELRDPAIALLAENRSQTGVASEYVAGLIALYEERFEDSLAAVESMVESAPWFYEALQLEGDIHRELSVRAGDASRDVALQGEEIRLAVDALERAAAIGRSDPGIYASLCGYRMREMGTLIFGNDPMVAPETIESAAAPCETALAVDSEAAGVASNRATMFVLLAMALERHGRDADEAYREASDAAARAVTTEPENPAAHSTQGWVNTMSADFERRSGLDPRPAAEGFEQGLEISADDRLVGHGGLAAVHVLDATSRLESGRSPGQALAGARAAADSALAIDPAHADTLYTVVEMETIAARWRIGLGRSPAAAFARATAAAEQAVAANADHAYGRRTLAEVHLWRARWLRGRGQPADEALQAGLEASAEALRINPRLAEAELVRGELELERSQVLGDEAAAAAAREEARTAFARALQLNGFLERRVAAATR